jgi:NADP-dependent 3-hydroxy acid dehydrogenase YdfG
MLAIDIVPPRLVIRRRRPQSIRRILGRQEWPAAPSERVRMRDPRSILITGASSGIGAALAKAYAGPGVHLALGGRDSSRLGAIGSLCRAAGATVDEGVVDVTDRAAMEVWLATLDDRHPVDLVIANAGISAGSAAGWERPEQARAIFSVNLEGTLNTVLPLLPAMSRRGSGQIAVMSSLASFRGYPGAPAYCASKAALRIWGEALRGDLWDTGIRVTVICPGYVASPMTEHNQFYMPLLMETDRAAHIMKRDLARGRARIAFPWPLYCGAWLLGFLPPVMTDSLLRRLPKKA